MGRHMPRGKMSCNLWLACDAMRCEAMQVRVQEPSGGLRHGTAEGRRIQSEQDWDKLAVRLQGPGPRGDGKIG